MSQVGAVKVVVGLLWSAAAAMGVAAAGSFALVALMEPLFDRLVESGRAFPYRGQAGEMALVPGAVGFFASIVFVFAVAVAVFLGRRVRRRRAGWRSLAVASAALISVSLFQIGFAWDGFTALEDELYNWWYTPFIVVTGVLFAGCLIAATVVAAMTLRLSSRVDSIEAR